MKREQEAKQAHPRLKKPTKTTPLFFLSVAFLFSKVKGDDPAVKELHNIMYRRPGKVSVV